MMFIFTLVFSSVFAASPCTSVNLTEKGKVFEGMPVHDQVGSQICFAYAAAQLLEAERVRAGAKYSPASAISPLSLALGLAYSNGHSDLQQGSTPCRAIDYARAQAVCPVSKTFKSSEEIIAHSQQFTNCQNNKQHPDCQAVKKVLPPGDARWAQTNPLAYVLAVEETLCRPADRIRLELPACQNLNDESRPSHVFRQRVDEAFDAPQPRPVQLGYSMHIFSYDGNAQEKYRIKREVVPDVIDFSLRYKPHASVLLGRKMGKNNKCQYLLRNTMGASFCPSGIAEKRGWECDKKSGGIWINQDELFDATFEVSTIGAPAGLPGMINQLEGLNQIDCQTCPPQ